MFNFVKTDPRSDLDRNLPPDIAGESLPKSARDDAARSS
jgi:hypothetical protein